MAHNKEELKERINNLPLYELREVYVTDEPEGKETTKQIQLAICEIGKTKSYAYVYPNYKLVQFCDIFTPIIDSIDSDVEGYLSHYEGFAMLKIFPDIEELKDGDNRFGLIAINSVDLSAAIKVKFCVQQNDRQFTIPTKVAGLYKQHTGNAVNITKNYISMIGQVKDAWKKICVEFPTYDIVLDITKTDKESALELGTVVKRLRLGRRLTKKIKEEYVENLSDGKSYTLWDVFIRGIEYISDRKYKSETHREKARDRICQAIFEYSILLGI